MDIVLNILSAILVPMFFIGMAGSLLVVIVTVVRDLAEITQDENAVAGDLDNPTKFSR